MRNLTKFFLTVAVAVMGVSCVTDMTEDLGVDLAGQTTLSVSLEEVTKTHLGGKSGDLYQLCWSEGDQISLNGVLSNVLAANEAGAANAEFTFEGVQTYPYNVLYPASADNTVTLLAEQTYTEGTFCANAAPMYGYAATEGANVKLNHLVGALRFAPRGEGVTLTSLVVKSQSGNIAGTYTIDCATGALTEVADTTSNSITVSFGENGLALGATATPIYVTVPAGSYGVFSVTLYTATDKMVAHFDSAAKPITAGTVREFGEFTYEANVAEDGVFLIENKEDMIRFSKIAGNFAPYTTAKVAANIDMTGVEWTSIDGFTSTFDGGNYEIKGLNAPLFGLSDVAAIKNVRLIDVNISTTDRITGALLRRTDSASSVISNCYASGKLVVTLNETEGTSYTGGLIGYITSSSKKTFSNLVNEVNIEVKGAAYASCLGGISGILDAGTFSNCVNLGNINYSSSNGDMLYYGGISGKILNATDCVNGSATDKTKGSITVSSNNCKTLRVGGIVGHALKNTALTRCVNYGTLTTTDTTKSSGSLFGGGIIGISQSTGVSYNACENHGDYNVYGSIATIKVGGLIGQCSATGDGAADDFTITNGFTNTGNILVANSASSGQCQIGGFSGNQSDAVASGSTGKIKNSGNITYRGTSTTTSTILVAGVISVATDNHIISGVEFINTGTVTADGANAPSAEISVAGIIADDNRKIGNARSYGDIVATKCHYVGAITAARSKSYVATNCHCGGTITKDGEKVTLSTANYHQYIYASDFGIDFAKDNKCGYISNIDGLPQIPPFTEIGDVASLKAFAANAANITGDVTITADIDLTGEEWTSIEGYTGTIHGNNHTITGLTAPLFGTTAASIEDLTLANVNIVETVNPNIGAFARTIDNANAVLHNCSASGTITVNCNMNLSASIFTAGLVSSTTSTKEFSKLTNNIDILVSGSYNNAGKDCYIHCAGCIGSNINGYLTDVTNLGSIEFTANTDTERVTFSGISTICSYLTNCVNGSATDNTKGLLKYNSTCGAPVYGGGIRQAVSTTGTYTKCVNYGRILFAEGAKSAGVIIGGVFGNYDSSSSSAVATFNECANHGAIDILSDEATGNIKVGGGFSQIAGSSKIIFLNGFTNTGNITVTVKSAPNTDKTAFIAGFAGGYTKGWDNSSTGVIKNTGRILCNIESSKVSYTKVAGIVGHVTPEMSASSNVSIVNTGNIIGRGQFGTTGYVGGIAGNTRAFYNTTCFCTVEGIGWTNVGMIVAGGRTSETRKVNNTKVGGAIIISESYVESEDEWHPIETKITEENFHKYIYSVIVDRDIVTADGNSFISSYTE